MKASKKSTLVWGHRRCNRPKMGRKSARLEEPMVFLQGWEPLNPWTPNIKTPALYCFNVEVLRAFVELHGSIEPPDELKTGPFSEGPILWVEEMSKLMFFACFWSVREHDFMPLYFHARETDLTFGDGNPALRLIGLHDLDSTAGLISSIPISIEALGQAVTAALKERCHLLMAEPGVAQFAEFAAFEHLFRTALEMQYNVTAEHCSVTEDLA